MISTRAHGTLDYVMGVVLILAPFLFGFATGGAEMWVPIILGAAVILYSLITAYERGVIPGISMRTHLWLDGLGGLFLALSPWLLGFASIVFLPHLIVGLGELIVVFTTEQVPQERPRRAAV
ncbi:MAG: SPW repeat protein [Balneolaceae bacterium]